MEMAFNTYSTQPQGTYNIPSYGILYLTLLTPKFKVNLNLY